MDPVIIPWYLNWYIPDLDPAIDYVIKELLRWSADNVLTIIVVTNILSYLKILAIRNGRVKDDKILTWLLGFITLKWIGKLTSPIPPPIPAGAKENPIVLTDAIEEQKEWKEKNTEGPKL